MGFLDFFRSKEQKYRSLVRAVFDEQVKNTIRENRDLVMNPLFGGMVIQAAIGSAYQTLMNEPKLVLFALQSNFNPYAVIEEECRRALNNYLE